MIKVTSATSFYKNRKRNNADGTNWGFTDDKVSETAT